MSDIEKVKQLRKSTGAGFKDCNEALKESNGDLDKAAEILRVTGIAKASKKMSRDATEGVIVISGDEKKMSLIEVNCETDFVAKNDEFIEFVRELSDLNNIKSSNFQKLQKAHMKNNETVEDNLIGLIAKVGEKITIGKLKTMEFKNSRNFYYQHTVIKENVSKLGVVVSLNTNEKSENVDRFGKQLSMHIAASNPLTLNADDFEQSLIDKEVNLIEEELKNSGKPEEIVKKISLGKLKKFKEENSLMTQDWVIDPSLKVKDVINSLEISDLSINNFIRLKIGE